MFLWLQINDNIKKDVSIVSILGANFKNIFSLINLYFIIILLILSKIIFFTSDKCQI